jgi:diguanylate cyclase (GGDEF)-like protein/PAS domain S-box-containing protein
MYKSNKKITSGERTFLLRNALFLKIILVFTLPAIGMLYFSAVLVYEKIETLSEVDNIQTNIRYITATEKLIHSVQKERGFTATYLTSNKFREKLNYQRAQTNSKYKDYLKTILKLNIKESALAGSIKKVQTVFYRLNLLRENIDKLRINPYDSLEQYNKINELLLDTIASIEPVLFASQFNEKFAYVINLLTAKEYAGIERALTSMILTNKSLSQDILNDLVRIYTIQDVNLKQFLLKASLTETHKYNEQITLSLENKLLEVRNQIRTFNRIQDVSVEQWWDISTNRINALGKVYDFVTLEISSLSQKLETDAYMAQILSLTFLFVSFITLTSLLFVLRNIIFNEQKSYTKINKQQDVYRLLSKANKFLLKIDQEKILFNKICKLIANNANMSYGFIYRVSKSEKVKFFAKQGPLTDLVEIRLNEHKDKNSLITRALNSKKNVIIDSFDEQNISILSNVSERFNLHSAAAFPIQRFNKTIAVLVLYANEKQFFDMEIEILFNQLVNDMTHALERIQYEKTRLKQENELRIASYAFESNEPMIITNSFNRIVNANQAFCTVMGYNKEDILGKNPSIFKSKHHDKAFYSKMWEEILKHGSWTGEIYNTMKDRKITPLRSTITAIKDNKGRITHFLGQYLDISEQKDRQKVLEYQATHDNLTGLPNRLLLLDRIERAITKVVRHNIVGGLVFIDLDNFKEVNDTLGHEIGDKLLILVAQKIKATIRDEDTIARIGGDEFIVLADCIGSDKDEAKNNMARMTEKIKEALNSITHIEEHTNISTPSIGVTLFSDASISVKDIIKQADTAMYQAKKQGKNTIEFFD